MSEIKIYGIETNNLKNIDVFLKKHTINLIIGLSGSGKSSLAYDTIAQIGQYEINSMFLDIESEPTYKVREYCNMLSTVPIKQMNNNNNIRSTIGTYFGINRNVVLLFSLFFNVKQDFFVLNKTDNLCPDCEGIGFQRKLDINRIIDYDIPLEKNPIKCWTKSKEFYSTIIKLFCEDNSIDYKKNFRMLSSIEKNIILNGESEKNIL